jgi:hypothetical protein
VLTKQVKNILISIALHLALFLFLSDTKIQKPLNKPDIVQPIKSFLYIPKIAPLAQKVVKSEIKKTTTIPKEHLNDSISTTKTTSSQVTDKSVPLKVDQIKKPLDNEIKSTKRVNKTPLVKPAIAQPVTTPTNNNFTRGQASSNQLLDNLRKRLNDEMIEKNVSEINQHRSLSAMHAQPKSVPYSAPVYNAIKEKEKNTTHYSDGLKMTKNSNGTCTVETDLSHVGIKGVTAIESFACGESTMERNFRSHMKKVQDKLR